MIRGEGLSTRGTFGAREVVVDAVELNRIRPPYSARSFGVRVCCWISVATTLFVAAVSPVSGSDAGVRPVPGAGSQGVSGTGPSGRAVVPAWGELIKTDIEVELPDEYAALDLESIGSPRWRFSDSTPEKAGRILADAGLTSSQVAEAMKSAISESPAGSPSTVSIAPDSSLVVSLSPEVRSRLYAALATAGVNPYMSRPYVVGRGDAERWLKKSQLPEEIRALIRSLVYRRAGLDCFSDLELVFGRLQSRQDRMHLLKAVSRRPAVLAALRVSPGADVDKLLGYWGRGIKTLDIRPVLEAVAAQEGGGTISLLHLLPRFAREHLFTFPTPPSVVGPAPDCHWTTLNFFNNIPDNSILTNGVSWNYINERFYRVGEASHYGDVLLFVSSRGKVVHSARFIADDLVFTKNGNDFVQPWSMMRLPDVEGIYRLEGAERTLVYRAREN